MCILANPNGSVTIYDNAIGCNSQQEVEDACEEVSVEELCSEIMFNISPNPCSGSVNIQFDISEQEIVSCDLFEISGVRIIGLFNEIKMPGIHVMQIDLKDLKPGIYFCVLQTGKEIQTVKIIKL